MPTVRDLVRLQKKYQNEAVTIVAVYASRSSRDAFKKHVTAKKLPYVAIYDEGERIGKAYGITDKGRSQPATPTFLIGRDGKVIWEKATLRHWPKSVGAVEALIDEGLKSRLRPGGKKKEVKEAVL